MAYIHERPEWPNFTWQAHLLAPKLAEVRHRQGRLIGRMEALGLELQAEASLQSLTEEAVQTSGIEGEVIDRDQIRSSLARQLGLDIGGLIPANRHIEGLAEMMIDATQNYDAGLTAERLFAWHAALFPTGRSGMHEIATGSWRTRASGPMQVVSGPVGRERVHFEAPDAPRLPTEMARFLAWFEDGGGEEPVIRAALAHLWFVTIHPFEDGNGRIARAITELGLARSEQSRQRFYSMSSQIGAERKAYYDILERTQKGGLDVTHWLSWFLDCLDRAFVRADRITENVLRKARFWSAIQGEPLNPRQRKVLMQLLDSFEGKLTTSKWAKLTKVSQDTASRDIDDLVRRGILARNAGGGRSTSYSLAATGDH